jgi:hypothetical protein
MNFSSCSTARDALSWPVLFVLAYRAAAAPQVESNPLPLQMESPSEQLLTSFRHFFFLRKEGKNNKKVMIVQMNEMKAGGVMYLE